MRTAAIEIHANSCLPEVVYRNLYSAGLVLVFMRTQPNSWLRSEALTTAVPGTKPHH